MRIEPTREYESYRRRVYRDVQEMWLYVRSRLESLSADNSQLETKVKEVLSELETREQVVLSDLEMMRENDGHDPWRRTEARNLSELVQTRLRDLQHPEACSSAKKLVCISLNKCGYGCQIHKIMHCNLIAYGKVINCKCIVYMYKLYPEGTERTLVLNSRGWSYKKKDSLPITYFENLYFLMSGQSHDTWPGSPAAQVLAVPTR